MKTQRAIITGFLIAAVFFTLCAFLLWPSRDTYFYISYLFVLLGFVAYFGSMYVLALTKFEKMPWRVPLLGLGRGHLIAAALITLVYAALSLFSGVLNDLAGASLFISVTVYVLAHLAVVASTAYRVNALLAGASLIDNVNTKRHAQAVSLRELASQAQGLNTLADSLPESIRRDAKSIIGKVADAIKYSDPVVPPKLAEIDNGIASGIASMKQALERVIADKSEDLAGLRASADKLASAIRDRNDKIRGAK